MSNAGQEIEREWALVFVGALTVVFGIILAVLPRVFVLSLVWTTGLYVLIFGVVTVALAFRRRDRRQNAGSRVA